MKQNNVSTGNLVISLVKQKMSFFVKYVLICLTIPSSLQATLARMIATGKLYFELL